MSAARWTPAETARLRALWPTGTATARLRAALGGRSLDTIRHRASRLGLGPRVGRRSPWTRADDARLRALWTDGYGERALRAAFPGRTWRAVYQRAKRLRLRLGIPQGHATVARAARACGVSRDGLLTILRWARVAVHVPRRSPDSPAPRRVLTPHVDAGDAVAAVERWDRRESLTDATHRVGVRASTLRRWLREADAYPPRPPRLDPLTVDRVVATHRPELRRTP